LPTTNSYTHLVGRVCSQAWELSQGGGKPHTFQIREHLAVSSFAALRISVRTEILSAAKDDTPASASFDAHIVFFEMYWRQAPPCGGAGQADRVERRDEPGGRLDSIKFAPVGRALVGG